MAEKMCYNKIIDLLEHGKPVFRMKSLSVHDPWQEANPLRAR